jgi:hypothetical protein
MKYLFPLTALSRDGETRLVYGVEAFREFARGRLIGERFSAWTLAYSRFLRAYEWIEKPNDWIVRDDRGRVVLAHAFDPTPSTNWKKRYRSRRGDFEHRNGPVPGLRGGYRRLSQGARKRHGGRGVAARIQAFHSHDARNDVE